MTAIGVMALVLAPAAAARPAAPPAQDVRAQEARKACAAGQVDRGIQLLAEIVAETGDPNALYNQGRCYQQNGRAEEAISRFREYLRVARDIPAGDVRTVKGYIEELEAELDAEARRATAGQARSAAPPLPAPAPARSVGERRSLRIASLALGVASVAALGAGIYFTMRVKTLNDRIADPTAKIGSDTYASWSSEGRRAEVLQWVGYGVSAGALAGAITCHLLVRSRERYAAGRPAAGPLVPVLHRAGAGALLRVTF